MFIHKNKIVPTDQVIPVPNIIIASNKFSLSWGINDYPGTQNDLKGCVNDAKNWNSLATELSFNTQMYLDGQATPTKIKEVFGNLMANSKSGDVILVTGSSHGTSIPDVNGDEYDGKDEAICLYGGLLVDDDIRGMINSLHPEAHLTIISDSCFSGSVTRAFLSTKDNSGTLRVPRYLPPADFVEAAQLIALPTKNRMFFPEEGMREILISGCKDNEYSYDTSLGGQSCGAFSYYAIKAIRENLNATYEQFYAKLRSYLPSSSFPQTPQLESSIENKKRILFT